MIEWIKRNEIVSKAVALIGAVFLWFYVVSNNNIDMSQTYSSIPVELTGIDTLSASNLIIVNGGQNTVSFKISGKVERLGMISSNDNLKVTADVSYITAPGVYDVNYRVTCGITDVTISKITPKISVEVDRLSSKSVPVDLVFNGSMQDGYISSDYTVRPDAIAVTGPEKLLETIVGAKVFFDISDIKSSTETTLSYTLVDSEGNEVKNSLISVDTPSVKLHFGVLKTSNIPLMLSLKDYGFITSDMVDISMEQDNITISGAPDVVSAINRIDLGSISLQQVFEEERFEFELPVILPDRVSSDSEIQSVNVTITPKGIKKEQIEFTPDMLPESSLFKYPSGLEITVWTTENNTISASSVDLSLEYSEEELTQGLNIIPVSITALDDDMIVIGQYSLTVEVP